MQYNCSTVFSAVTNIAYRHTRHSVQYNRVIGIVFKKHTHTHCLCVIHSAHARVYVHKIRTGSLTQTL